MPLWFTFRVGAHERQGINGVLTGVHLIVNHRVLEPIIENNSTSTGAVC